MRERDAVGPRSACHGARGAVLARTNFTNASLSATNLSHANLTAADFTSAAP